MMMRINKYHPCDHFNKKDCSVFQRYNLFVLYFFCLLLGQSSALYAQQASSQNNQDAKSNQVKSVFKTPPGKLSTKIGAEKPVAQTTVGKPVSQKSIGNPAQPSIRKAVSQTPIGKPGAQTIGGKPIGQTLSGKPSTKTGDSARLNGRLPSDAIIVGHPGKNDTIVLAGFIINGDTLGHIWLGNVDVKEKMIYHNDLERIKYLTLRRDVLKVLPFARSAGYKYRTLQYQLSQTTDRKKKRELIKALERDLKDNYEKPLKDLTITQGRILIKLIDRETGQTSFAVVKDLKSGFSAFMLQSIAGLIGDNLKEHYDPEKDKDIEFIIQSFGY